jgi:FHS family L-fucose permease-like MFS transporter
MQSPNTIISSSSAANGSSRGYLIPFMLVTSLFFLWGLANILNSALIAQFQPVFEITRAQALLVETAFYLGYFTIALPAGLFMEKFSYKKGIVLGLLLYAIGAFLFIPAANLLTFGFFLVALYVIASGLAFLETGANPYVIMLGKPSTATLRLNFAQTFNGVALVVGPWIAGQFIFAGNEGSLSSVAEKQSAADAVILPYTVIGIIVVVVALLFLIVRMPEPDKGQKLRFDSSIFKNRHLVRAVIAQFFYVGAQAGIWGITINFVIELLPETSKEVASKNFLTLGTLLFVSGRVIGTLLMTFIKDNRLLATYAVIAAALCMVGVFTGGTVAVYALLAINFFMSIMFPTIFALGVKDLGDYTKMGSSLIIMAIVGGAVVPPLMGLIPLKLSLLLPFFSFVVIFFYGISGYKIKSV